MIGSPLPRRYCLSRRTDSYVGPAPRTVRRFHRCCCRSPPDRRSRGHAQRITLLQHVTELLRHLRMHRQCFQLRLYPVVQRLAFLFPDRQPCLRRAVDSVICDSVHQNLSGHYHRRIDRVLTDVLHGALTFYLLRNIFAF